MHIDSVKRLYYSECNSSSLVPFLGSYAENAGNKIAAEKADKPGNKATTVEHDCVINQ